MRQSQSGRDVSRREFVASTLAAAATLTSLGSRLARGAEGAGRRPNIVFMVADDLNTELGCLGSAVARTPNLDRLGKRGVLFTNAHCQAPLCNPSRTSCLSGLRPETTRVLDNSIPPNAFIPDLKFMHRYFGAAGYHTCGVGKLAQMTFHETFNSKGLDVSHGIGPQWNSDKIAAAKPQPMGHYFRFDADERVLGDNERARRAIAYLGQAAGGSQPFLLHLGFTAVHTGTKIPARFFELYPEDKIALPPAPTVAQQEQIARTLGGRKSGPLSDAEKADFVVNTRAYYAAISYLDSLVGDVMETLSELGLWDNTIVVFTSDHGYSLNPWTGGKGDLWAQGTRVPLIVCAPAGRASGQTCRRVVEELDLLPTLLELCGLPPEPILQGRSLAPLLEDPAREWDRHAQCTHIRGKTLGHAVIAGKYHYVKWDESQFDPQLYDVESDPLQYENLALKPEYAAKAAELDALIVRGEQPLDRPPKRSGRRDKAGRQPPAEED